MRFEKLNYLYKARYTTGCLGHYRGVEGMEEADALAKKEIYR